MIVYQVPLIQGNFIMLNILNKKDFLFTVQSRISRIIRILKSASRTRPQGLTSNEVGRGIRPRLRMGLTACLCLVRDANKITQLTLISGVLIIGISATSNLYKEISEIAREPIHMQESMSALAPDGGAVDQEFKYDHILVTSSAFRASLAPPQYRQILLRRVWVPITAYSSTPDQTDSTPFITASGTRVRDGVIAANFLPIGTKVKIPTMYGEKVFVVEDRMNSRYWLKMDIWMPTRAEALQFGLRTLPIEVIREI